MADDKQAAARKAWLVLTDGEQTLTVKDVDEAILWCVGRENVRATFTDCPKVVAKALTLTA